MTPVQSTSPDQACPSPASSADRILDPAEAYFHMLDQVSTMNFVVVVERAGPLDPGRVSEALLHLQAEEPLLRVGIALTADATGFRFVESPGATIPLEVAHVRVDSRGVLAAWAPWIERQLKRPFPPGSAPLARCTLLQSGAQQKACLAVTLHHSIADGRSGAEIVRRLLNRVATPVAELGPPIQRAPVPPMHSVFPSQFRWADHPGALRAAAGVLMRESALSGQPNALPWFVKTPHTRDPRLLWTVIDGERLMRLTASARSRGLTVHSVLTAAQLLSQYRLLGTDQRANLLLTCPVDMRQHSSVPVDVAPTAVYASNLYATYAVDARTDVFTLAKQVMTRTREQAARGDAHLFFSSREVSKALAAPSDLAAFARMVANVPHGSVLSAVGLLPVVELDPEVQSISFAICSAPHHALFSAASTYMGRMVISTAYDDNNLVPGTAERLIQLMEQVLDDVAASVPAPASTNCVGSAVATS